MKLVVATVLLMASAALAAPVSPPLPAKGHVPTSTCVSMVPVHGNNKPSERPSPYTLTVTPASVNGGNLVKVHITGTEEFRGVYIQARRGDEPVGEFVLTNGETVDFALSDCPPGEKNALTYIGEPKTELDLDWKAPNIDGEIVFRTTFVKTFSEFWVGVESPAVAITASSATKNAVAA